MRGDSALATCLDSPKNVPTQSPSQFRNIGFPSLHADIIKKVLSARLVVWDASQTQLVHSRDTDSRIRELKVGDWSRVSAAKEGLYFLTGIGSSRRWTIFAVHRWGPECLRGTSSSRGGSQGEQVLGASATLLRTKMLHRESQVVSPPPPTSEERTSSKQWRGLAPRRDITFVYFCQPQTTRRPII